MFTHVFIAITHHLVPFVRFVPFLCEPLMKMDFELSESELLGLLEFLVAALFVPLPVVVVEY